jgi:hypothetical protein
MAKAKNPDMDKTPLKPFDMNSKQVKSKKFSKAMISRVMQMNTKTKALETVAKTLVAQAQQAGQELNDYISYCREELNAPVDQYDLKDLNNGFTLIEEPLEREE